MFEWLLSDFSSRDPNTALSDQNSRMGLWLGKQAAILFFHSFISVRLQQECIRSVFLDPWSLWRGLRIFQGPRPTKVPARYLHVNKPPLRNYCWCFCALPLQNLTANYAMATLSTPFARMLIITVSLSSFLPAPHFTLCISNPGSPRNTSVFRHLPLSVILLWCGSCFIRIPPKGSSSSLGC